MSKSDKVPFIIKTLPKNWLYKLWYWLEDEATDRWEKQSTAEHFGYKNHKDYMKGKFGKK